jgi:hypothetical protein
MNLNPSITLRSMPKPEHQVQSSQDQPHHYVYSTLAL